MIDFKELPQDGDEFELLIRELLYAKGLEVYWSGKGADGGKDLLCIERYESHFKSSDKRWLVQCKHNAHSGRAVSKNDLDSIVDSCSEHGASGYLLVCSTFPTSNLIRRMEEIQNTKGIITHFWDCKYLERELLKPSNWNIANMFFRKSLSASGWNISAIEPSFWYASYKGHILYIASRITTSCEFFLEEIERRIASVDAIELEDGGILRIRALYFDDKNTNYIMYLDYLMPKDAGENEELLEYVVGELESFDIIDGIPYRFDIMTYKYNPCSDSFDIDSNAYYNGFIDVFKNGMSREGRRKYVYANRESPRLITEEFVNGSFNELKAVFGKLPDIKILNAVNARVEFIDQFTENFAWHNTIVEADHHIDNFFSAEIRFVCENFDLLTEALAFLPQSACNYFELVRNYIIMEGEGLDCEDEEIYTIYISIHPGLAVSKYQLRKELNCYLHMLAERLEIFIQMHEAENECEMLPENPEN